MRKALRVFLTLGLLTAVSRPLSAQDVAKEYDLQEVQVTAERHDFGTRSSQMSTVAVSAEQIKRLPMLMGETDVLKSLQQLPGVQSGGEGRSGIFVRGGDYDQNLFLLDGITLYNPEHLQGFTSAINADLMDDVVLFKGAFPSRFGSRLSSVIDIGLREGDMRDYHASVTAGMLASRVQAEGPLWKDHTSFNIGARVSYFNAIVSPLLKEVVYDNPGQMNNFSHMRYYDINAKLVHRFSDNARVSAVFYLGHDVNDATPNETSQSFEYDKWEKDQYGNYRSSAQGYIDNDSGNRRSNKWNNLLGGIAYEQVISPSIRMNAGVSYSGYDYSLDYSTTTLSQTAVGKFNGGREAATLYSMSRNSNTVLYKSKVNDLAMYVGVTYILADRHEARGGVSFGIQESSPRIMADFLAENKRLKYDWMLEDARTHPDEDYDFREERISNTLDGKNRLTVIGAYAEDDWNLTDRLKVNLGLRLQGFSADGKTHIGLEPRVSARFMIARGLALKASYARMTQGMFLLTSNSLVTPSEVWTGINADMKPGRSDQVSAGMSKEFGNGILLSVEGYYKRMDNVVDYREGVSFSSAKNWHELIAQGKGKAYGVELLVQKTIGKTRGQVSYTWSKSLRTFDRPGMEINGGKEFYAAGDRRHNLSISVTQRLSRNWDFSASWTYQSGRRANISTSTTIGGLPDEFNNYRPGWIDTPSYKGTDYTQNPAYRYDTNLYYDDTRIGNLVRLDTYRQRNSYTLPAVHRLDISLSHHGSIGIGEMICDIGIYNLYNRQNLSSVYWGYTSNRRALKGVCMFPIMPSVSLTLKL